MLYHGLYYKFCICSANLDIPKLYCHKILSYKNICEIARKDRHFPQCRLCGTNKNKNDVDVLTFKGRGIE